MMKLTKRILPLFGAALTAAVLMGFGKPTDVLAQDYTMTGTVEESYTAEVGETLVIPLKVSSDYDMRGLTAKLADQYDDTILEFEKAEYTDGIPSGLESIAGGNFGFITSGTFKSGTVNLEFKVKKCSPDPVSVTIKDLYASVQVPTDDGKTTTVSTTKTTLTTEVTVNHPSDQLEETVIKEATCTEKGEKNVKCNLCGADLGTQEIPALGHEFGKAEVVKEATCTEEGKTVQKCSRCDQTIEESIPKKDHESDGGKVTKEATCTSTGVKTYSCKNCGKELKTETIAQTAHVSDDGKVTKEATCAEEGEKTYSCKVCGAVIKTEKIAKTTDHTWEVTTDTDKDGWKVVTKATSTTAGSKERVCKVCGTKETKAIAKISATTTTTTGKKTGSTGTTSTGSSSGGTSSAAKTGDTANVAGMIAMMVAAAAVLAAAVIVLIRRRRRA